MSELVPRGLRPAYDEPVRGGDVRPKLLELLGIEELPQTVEFELSEPTEEEGLQLRSVSYANSLGETVPGVLCVPGGAGPLPGIVCIPGTGGSAEQLTDAGFRLEAGGGGSYRMLVGWARELARRGFATLSISVKGGAGRGAPAGQPEGTPVVEEWHQQTKMLAAYGVHMMGLITEEALKASRVLQGLPEVDGARVGVTGMSLGGAATFYAMAGGPWLAAAVPVCGGVGSVAREIHDGSPEIHAAHWYVPNILRHFDHADMVSGSIAPRPFMIVSPTEDGSMTRAGVDDLVPVVRAAYESAGVPGNFEVHQPQGGHVFEPQYFEWMADWFKYHLMGV